MVGLRILMLVPSGAFTGSIFRKIISFNWSNFLSTLLLIWSVWRAKILNLYFERIKIILLDLNEKEIPACKISPEKLVMAVRKPEIFAL